MDKRDFMKMCGFYELHIFIYAGNELKSERARFEILANARVTRKTSEACRACFP